MSKGIVFTKTLPVSDAYCPKPASDFLPEWYKKTKSYVNDIKEPLISSPTPSTIKKCMPVFDALTSGYIIPTYCDLWIRQTEDKDITYQTSMDINITFHPVAQAPYHPYMNEHAYPKWTNPWGIKTPPGYSCLFIAPVHGGNSFFKVVEGIVDTDKMNAPVNFPFVLNDSKFEGLIPAGTPMVQVIPFKRDSWKMSMGDENSKNNIRENIMNLDSRFFDRYKTLFWNAKKYK
jgi:hypothetical protein